MIKALVAAAGVSAAVWLADGVAFRRRAREAEVVRIELLSVAQEHRQQLARLRRECRVCSNLFRNGGSCKCPIGNRFKSFKTCGRIEHPEPDERVFYKYPFEDKHVLYMHGGDLSGATCVNGET